MIRGPRSAAFVPYLALFVAGFGGALVTWPVVPTSDPRPMPRGTPAGVMSGPGFKHGLWPQTTCLLVAIRTITSVCEYIAPHRGWIGWGSTVTRLKPSCYVTPLLRSETSPTRWLRSSQGLRPIPTHSPPGDSFRCVTRPVAGFHRSRLRRSLGT